MKYKRETKDRKERENILKEIIKGHWTKKEDITTDNKEIYCKINLKM